MKLQENDIVRVKLLCSHVSFSGTYHAPKAEQDALENCLGKVLLIYNLKNPYHVGALCIMFRRAQFGIINSWVFCPSCVRSELEFIYRPGTKNVRGLATVLFENPELLK